MSAFVKIFGSSCKIEDGRLPVGLFAERSLWVFSQEESQEIAAACDFASTAEKFELEALPFGSDVYGDLWASGLDGRVHRIWTETFEPIEEYASIAAWADTIVKESDPQLGWGMLSDWEGENGELPAGSRLAPKIPFVLGGQYAVSNLYSLAFTEILRFRRYFATQIEDLPDGARIWIDTEDE